MFEPRSNALHHSESAATDWQVRDLRLECHELEYKVNHRRIFHRNHLCGVSEIRGIRFWNPSPDDAIRDSECLPLQRSYGLQPGVASKARQPKCATYITLIAGRRLPHVQMQNQPFRVPTHLRQDGVEKLRLLSAP